MKKIPFLIVAILFCVLGSTFAQDTAIVQTFTFDSTSRKASFQFPTDDYNSYEKILMQYRIRCKGGKINTTGGNDVACGEWDYSCNTYVTDSTRKDSLPAVHPSYIISDFTGTTFSYTATPTYDLLRRIQKSTSYSATTSETEASINKGTTAFSNINPTYTAQHLQFLYTAAELNTAGLSSGDISGLKLPLQNANGQLKNLRISLKNVSATELTTADFTGLSEVYYNNTNINNGSNFLRFYQNFNWNGTDNILVDISFDLSATASLEMLGNGTIENNGLHSQSSGYLNFRGGGNIRFEDIDFTQLEDEITFSFWTFGDANYLGTNPSTILYGADASNNRQVNIHLPWNNGNVYWDCGNDGSGFDRIEKAASPSMYEGQWNYWSFVKDATIGSMKVYYNGTLFNTGTSKNKNIILEYLNLGTDPSAPNNKFVGLIDDFHCYNKALNQAEIQALMQGNESALNANEVIDLEISKNGIIEQSSQTNTFVKSGAVSIKNVFGNDLNTGFKAIPQANLIFVQGVYTLVNTDNILLDTIYFPEHDITAYDIQNNTPTIISTTSGYAETTTTTYNENGTVYASTPNTLENSITISNLNYFKTSPAKVELMSFVTPYGNQLDLGIDGKMWEFDVTDFAPILTDSRTISIERGGERQEDMDIRFLFIKGTPERNILSFNQIWPVNGVNYSDIQADKQFQAVNVPIPNGAKTAKIRSVITGHGQEGEFIPQNHQLNINNGAKKFTWQVWKKCGDNPIYPQGGTWVFDRAGWCPGAPTDIKEWDVSPYITAGTNLKVDYNVIGGSGDTRYIVNQQIITYGDYNFVNDAAIEYITKPSQKTEFSRFNVACTQPEILVKNNGSNTITSLTIDYWVSPTNKKTYVWNGNIIPSTKQTIILPNDDVKFWLNNTENVFYTEITQVNGGADEYANNNTYKTDFTPVDVYFNFLALTYQTNKRGNENSFKIFDIEGNEVFSKSGFISNRAYKNNFELPAGCYRLEWYDTGEDGLDFWYWAAAGDDRGKGYLKLQTEAGATLKTFNPDYGTSVIYDFIIDETTAINKLNKAVLINLFPNPSADGIFSIYLSNPQAVDEIEVVDLNGKIIAQIQINTTSKNIELNLTTTSKGVYICNFKSNRTLVQTKRLLKL